MSNPEETTVFELHEGHRIVLNGMPKKLDGSAGQVDGGIITFTAGQVSVGADDAGPVLRDLLSLHHFGTSDPADPPAPTLSTINGVEVWLPMGALSPQVLGSAEFIDVDMTVSADVDLGIGIAPIAEKVTIRCIPLGASSLNVIAGPETPIPSSADSAQAQA